jgi:hypothetical protein
VHRKIIGGGWLHLARQRDRRHRDVRILGAGDPGAGG